MKAEVNPKNKPENNARSTHTTTTAGTSLINKLRAKKAKLFQSISKHFQRL